ncbi:hypothetical protein CFP56_031092, partial [Quercus suber]
LSSDTDEVILKDAFGRCGELIEDLLEGIMLSYLAIKIICDHISGRSKGYWLVQFTSKTM